MSKMATGEDACREEVIRQIERGLRKGYVEGVVFNSCVNCDSGLRIAVPSAHVSVSGSSVRWKSYGSSGEKIRK